MLLFFKNRKVKLYVAKHRELCTMFYHLWTMKKPLEEVQQGATVSMSNRENTIRKIKQGDKYNCEISTSQLPFIQPPKKLLLYSQFQLVCHLMNCTKNMQD